MSIYDTATPGGLDDPREADDEMRLTKAAIQERMNDHNGQADEGDHYWPLTGTEVSDEDAGQHRMVTLRQLSVNPSALTSYANTTDLGFLYQKDVSNNGELFWEDEADNVVQLTSGGGLAGGTVNGNRVITGTLDVTGLTTVADGSVTKTTAAPTTDAMIVNKKYVDDNVGKAQMKVDDVVGGLVVSGTESITHANGFIEKFGIHQMTSDTDTIVFETAFPGGCLNVQLTPAATTGTTSNNWNAHTRTTTDFKIYKSSASGQSVFWKAVGY
jgi:hypothetical protein